MNDFFQKNLEALLKASPYTGTLLFSVAEAKRFQVFVDNDPANINIIDSNTNKPLYYGKPVEELQKSFLDMTEFTHYPFLYFYGMGNGLLYKMLLSNQNIKRIVVVEPEVELLYIGLHFADFSKDINDERFLPILSEELDFVKANSIISSKDSKIYSKLYDLHIHSSFYNDYIDDFVSVNKLFTRAIEHQILSAGNDSTDAIIGLKHHIINMPEMVNSPTIFEFLHKIKNTQTAIIVSTGPSLAKQLPLLKEMQEYVTIFCIDASFPILCKWGIKPDIVISLERIELTADFYKQTPVECQEDVVFAITSIVHEELKKSIQKGQKAYSMRPFGYTKYFGLEHWGYAGIGMSAANLAFEFVYYSSFKNCIFIGQDLAFGEGGRTHSDGFILDEEPYKKNQNSVYVEKYGGGGEVRTTAIWKAFINFFESDISKAVERVNVINSTEGGARIHGTKEIPFATAISECVKRDQKKSLILLDFPSEEIKENALKRAKSKINNMLKVGKERQKKIEELFLKTTKMTEEWEKLNKEQKLEEMDFDAINRVIDEIDDVKEFFIDEEFVRMFIDAVQSYIIHQELEIAKIQVKYCADEWQKKAKLLEWIYVHKYWLFSLAGGIDSLLAVVKEAALTWMDESELEIATEETKEETSE